MEKQTIGGFLATLRKANGYTQQEVAEKLGVSNKTLSSWETDKTCPDLTLIPVLADLYGVSADEILRAERRKTGGAASEEERSRDEARAAKSVRALLGRQEKKIGNINSVLRGAAVGVWVLLLAGILFFMYVNTVASVIFFVLFVCGAVTLFVLLHVFTENALGFADEEDKTAGEETAAYKRRVVTKKYVTILLLLVPLLFVLLVCPLLVGPFLGNIYVWDALGFASTFAPLAALLILLFINVKYRSAINSYVSERKRSVFVSNGKLLKRCTAGGLIGWGVCTSFCALVAALPSLFVFYKTVYSTPDKAELKKYVQSINFEAYDIPVQLGGLPTGEYYFELGEAMEELLKSNDSEKKVDLDDGFFLAKDYGNLLVGAGDGITAYQASLFWRESTDGLMETSYSIVRGIRYSEQFDVYLLRDDDEWAAGHASIVREKKGRYSFCREKDLSKIFLGIGMFLEALPVPLGLVIYAVKRKNEA